MRIRMDGPAQLRFVDGELWLDGTSGGEPVQLAFQKTHTDQMAAEYFDMLAGPDGPPALLASFVSGLK